MRRTRLLAIAITAACLVLPAGMAAAQEYARVRLASSSGPAGGQVAAPLQVTIPEGVEIGSLHVTMATSGTVITFSDVLARGLAEALGVTARYTFTAKGAEGIVDLTLEAPPAGGVRPALPSGPLADVLYKVAPDAKIETVVPVRVTATATGTRPGGPPLRVEASDTNLVVSQGYIPPCFFYMH